jgi:hypothetical protein
MSHAKLYELKRGDKFYDMDDIIMVMIECIYDVNTPDTIEYTARQFKTDIVEKYRYHGEGVAERTFLRFRRRDKNSYEAGFKTAMMLCTKYMQEFELENAGLDGDVKWYLVMHGEYLKWKKNQTVI